MNKKTGILLAGVAAVIIVAGAVFVGSGGAGGSAGNGPKISGQMQNFVLAERQHPFRDIAWKDVRGKDVKLSDFKGKLVLLNFWATWCAPCIRELPSIDALQKQLGGDDFTVVALNIDIEGKRAARRMARRLKLENLELYMDKKNLVVGALNIRTMPTTILYDRQGRKIGKMEGGAEWNGPEAVSLIKYFIDNPDHADKLGS